MRKYLLNILIVLFIGFVAFTAVSCSDVSDSTSGSAKLAENKSYLDTSTDRYTEYVAYCYSGENVSKYASLESSNSSCGLTVSGNTVTITTDESATIYVRTESRNLIIDAKNADVHHYGSAGNVTIKHVKGSSYHGHATVTQQLTLESGHAELNEIDVPLVVSSSEIKAINCKIGTYKAMSNYAVLTVNNSKVSFVEKAAGVTEDKITGEGTVAHDSSILSPSKLIEKAKTATPLEKSAFNKSMLNDLNSLLGNLLVSFVPRISTVSEDTLFDNFKRILSDIFDSQKSIDNLAAKSIQGKVVVEFDGKFAVHNNNVEGIQLTVEFQQKKITSFEFTDTANNKLDIDFVYLVYLLQQSESIKIKVNDIDVSFITKGTTPEIGDTSNGHTFKISLNKDSNVATNITISRSYVNIENLALSCKEQDDKTDHYLNFTVSARIAYKVSNEEDVVRFSFDVNTCTIQTDIKFSDGNTSLNLDGIITADDSTITDLCFDKENKKFTAEGLNVNLGAIKSEMAIISSYTKTKNGTTTDVSNVLNLIVESSNLNLAVANKNVALSITNNGSIAAGIVLNDQNIAFNVNQLNGFMPVWDSTSAILFGETTSAEGIVSSSIIKFVLSML